jgi:hypothetical protein
MTELNVNDEDPASRKKWEPPVMTEASIQSFTLSGASCVSESFCPGTPFSKAGS